MQEEPSHIQLSDKNQNKMTELLMKMSNKLIINSFHLIKKIKWINWAIVQWQIITVLVMAEVVGQTAGRGGGG